MADHMEDEHSSMQPLDVQQNETYSSVSWKVSYKNVDQCIQHNFNSKNENYFTLNLFTYLK